MGNTIEAKMYDSVARKKELDRICRRYPFIKKKAIGRSCAGRDILAYEIGSGEEIRLFAAAFHGSEHITSVVLMMFLEEVARAIAESRTEESQIGNELKSKRLLFVPCVNPDGCDIAVCKATACGSHAARIGKLCQNDFEHWNANLRGVDLNHNFNAGWQELRQKEMDAGIYGPRPTRYGGPAPESEPETKALTTLCRTRHIRHVVALHSQGEVIYYRYGEKTPERGRRMAEVMSAASGYAIEEPEGLGVGGGFKDWFIQTFGRPGFTIELGRGENPLPPESARDIYEKARQMLTVCAVL